MVDVSAQACSGGFLQGVCDGILSALYGDEETEDQEDATNGEDGEETNGETTKSKKRKKI